MFNRRTMDFSNIEIIRSDRRTLSASVKSGKLIVRAPRKLSEKKIFDFLKKHEAWIEKNLEKSKEKELTKVSLKGIDVIKEIVLLLEDDSISFALCFNKFISIIYLLNKI